MIRVRRAVDADAAYVAATAMHQVPRFVRHVPRPDLAMTVRALLNTSTIVVACSAEDEETLVGWSAAIGGVPWFTFVTRELRGLGIGAELRKEATQHGIRESARGDAATGERPTPQRPHGDDGAPRALAGGGAIMGPRAHR